MIHDLTINQSFSDKHKAPYSNFIIDRNHIDELTSPDDEVIFTGSWLDRQRKMFYVNYGSNNICERCGSHIFNSPWSLKIYTDLCERCNKDLQNNYETDQKKPWDTSDESIRETDNIFLWD